jgi:hypothetical protein
MSAVDLRAITEARVRAKSLAVSAVMLRLGVTDPAAAHTLAEAHDVVWDYLAPFVVKVTGEMLQDIRRELEVNPGRKIAFLGRDGHSLAIAARSLEPELYEKHCTELVLSRPVVDAAVQELELHRGRSFPELVEFRRAAAGVSPDDIPRAGRRLFRYMQANGLPVGELDSEITLVDTSFKGTIQELLTALYPQTSLNGRYVFFGASPGDPHPGTKRGYALHLDLPSSNGGSPLRDLPDDRELTFAHRDAIASVEDTLNGAWSSPRRIRNLAPDQSTDARTNQAVGINPLRVARLYADPGVRRAVKALALVTTKQYADLFAERRDLGEGWEDELTRRSEGFRLQLHAWIGGERDNPEFARMMNSFVRRGDRDEVAKLSAAIHQAGLPGHEVREIWKAYDSEATIEGKRSFVSAVVGDHDRAAVGHRIERSNDRPPVPETLEEILREGIAGARTRQVEKEVAKAERAERLEGQEILAYGPRGRHVPEIRSALAAFEKVRPITASDANRIDRALADGSEISSDEELQLRRYQFECLQPEYAVRGGVQDDVGQGLATRACELEALSGEGTGASGAVAIGQLSRYRDGELYEVSLVAALPEDRWEAPQRKALGRMGIRALDDVHLGECAPDAILRHAVVRGYSVDAVGSGRGLDDASRARILEQMDDARVGVARKELDLKLSDPDVVAKMQREHQAWAAAVSQEERRKRGPSSPGLAPGPGLPHPRRSDPGRGEAE